MIMLNMDSARDVLAKAVQHAEKNIVPLEVLKAQAEGGEGPDYPLWTISGHPSDINVVLTHEVQMGGVLCRHMSLSVNQKGRVPAVQIVLYLLEPAGFIGGLENCVVWEEPCGNGQKAINLLQPISGNMDEIRKKVSNVEG